MIAQRPPALIKGNVRAAQKSLHGNVAQDRLGENYDARGGKIRKEARLGGFRLCVRDQPRGARGPRGKENEGLLLPFFIPVIPRGKSVFAIHRFEIRSRSNQTTLGHAAFRWAPGRYRSRYRTAACPNVVWFDLVGD